jgi:anti-sigma factor (TIGR02949 family)
MSTPDQSKMKQDCENKKDCLEMLQLIIDGEATTAQKDLFLKDHLEQCMPCYQSYNLEMAIRQLLKTKCSEHAPQDLVDSIKKKVTENLVR